MNPPDEKSPGRGRGFFCAQRSHRSNRARVSAFVI
jgi:hypothetical protein